MFMLSYAFSYEMQHILFLSYASTSKTITAKIQAGKSQYLVISDLIQGLRKDLENLNYKCEHTLNQELAHKLLALFVIIIALNILNLHTFTTSLDPNGPKFSFSSDNFTRLEPYVVDQ